MSGIELLDLRLNDVDTMATVFIDSLFPVYANQTYICVCLLVFMAYQSLCVI